MRFTHALLWLPPLLVLGGCPSNPNPPPTPQLSAVAVTCTPSTLSTYKTAQCSASATDQNGEPFSVSGFTWTSSNAAVAQVDSSGKVSALSAGSVTVSASATANDVTQQGQASFTVTDTTPTVHATTPITASETWHASDNPHLVRGSLEVNAASAPTLTLEAGVVVFFEPDAELRFTQGSLKAVGTQAAPIVLKASTATAPKGSWRGLVFSTAGSASQLEYVTLSHCGATSGKSACVDVEGTAAPVLHFVSIDNSGSVGVSVADDGSAFGATSTQLSVKDGAGAAVSLGANQADSLPLGGSFTGNTPNLVALKGDISRTLTWSNPGIPYLVSGAMNVQSDAGNTLTLAAGTVVRFADTKSILLVGDSKPGDLIVDGTASAPVLLTTNSASPQPGQWGGVVLLQSSSKASRISHVTIEYAGSPDNYITYGSSSLSVVKRTSTFEDCSDGPLLDGVVIQKGALGINISGTGIGAGSTPLTIRDTDSPIVMDTNCASTLPAATTISGGAVSNFVNLSGNLTTSQTWPKLSVPYFLSGITVIGGPSTPTLTLAPGTEILFNPDSSLGIGGAIKGTTYSGNLVAQGTAADPIRFTSMTAGAKGEWYGLQFSGTSTGSKLDHVIVSGGGEVFGGSFPTGANVSVSQEMGAFITNSTFSDSSGCGIARKTSGSPPVTTDFTLATYANTFTNNTGAAQCDY